MMVKKAKDAGQIRLCLHVEHGGSLMIGFCAQDYQTLPQSHADPTHITGSSWSSCGA